MTEDLTLEENIAVSKRLQAIAREIDRSLREAAGGKRVPFSLYTWGGHRSQYVSNAPRDDVKRAMQETLDRWSEDDGPLREPH